MHITFMQFCGVWSVGLGCYALVALALPSLRPRKLQAKPGSLFIIGACFCFLLGLWAFAIARPYTFIGALVVWAFGFFVERLSAKPARVDHEREDS
jgi:fatty acid desaturase